MNGIEKEQKRSERIGAKLLEGVAHLPKKGKDFERHLENASKIVSTWPTWKQTLLGGSPSKEKKMEPKFKTGDVVSLKSGGPSMTVSGVTNTYSDTFSYKCCWFDGGDLRDGFFFEEMLTTAVAKFSPKETIVHGKVVGKEIASPFPFVEED